VYDDKAIRVQGNEADQQNAGIEESCLIEAQLEAYDRHVEAM